jgi:hypothetical protein
VQVLVDGFLHPAEVAESVLAVTAEEVGHAPHISAAEAAATAAAAAEAAKRAAAALVDDAPARALIDMMGGALEGKDELTAMQVRACACCMRVCVLCVC